MEAGIRPSEEEDLVDRWLRGTKRVSRREEDRNADLNGLSHLSYCTAGLLPLAVLATARCPLLLLWQWLCTAAVEQQKRKGSLCD